jgi:hypothetical protein
MKRRFISWVYMALVLLAALAFPGCPLEDEVPTSGSTIRLTNIPPEVLNGNGYGFLAVFRDKGRIGPRARQMEPLTGYEPGALKLSMLGFWRKGNSLEVSFGGAVTGSQKYVLVLGLSSVMDESTGTTYTTNGDGTHIGTGGGNFTIAGNGAPINPVVVNYDENGVAEIDFSTNFKYTGTRDDLLANKGGAW